MSNQAPTEQELLEHRIERSRQELVERIDELDAKLRHQLDKDRQIHEHAPALAGAAAAAGFFLGWKAPAGLLIAGAIGGAIFAAKKMREQGVQPVANEQF